MFAALAALAMIGCATGRGIENARVVDVQLQGASDQRFEARVLLPRDQPVALAVLFGGGLGTDMHWTVPASIEHEGRMIWLTTGGATRDADALADALLHRNVAVFQHASLPAPRPHEPEPPPVALPFDDSRQVARAALQTALSFGETRGLPVVVIGHSLGAARALQVSEGEPRVAGYVLLAGAQLSLSREEPVRIEQAMVDSLRLAGADLDAGATPAEWLSARGVAPPELRAAEFAALDLDGDGRVRRWEAAGALHLARLDSGDRTFQRPEPTLRNLPHPAVLLLRARKPTLALFGGLDPMSYHGAMLERIERDQGEPRWLTVEIYPGLWHNLCEVRARSDGEEAVAGAYLVGPIDPAVCARVADFAADVAGR